MTEQRCKEQSNKKTGAISGIAYKLAALLIILGFIVSSHSANQSYAWFTDKQEGNYELVSGKVHYAVEMTTQAGLMVPGKNMISGMKLTNLSTIDTDVRMKIAYTVWRSTAGAVTSKSAIYTTNGSITGTPEDQYLDLTTKASGIFEPVLASDGAIWWQNTTTVAAIAKEGIGEVKELPFEAVCYSGTKTGNVFAGRPVVIQITLQAKQREHVKWSEITIYEEFKDTGA